MSMARVVYEKTGTLIPVFLRPNIFLQLSGGSWVFMATTLTIMKTNIYLLLVLLIAPVALALGASLLMAFSLFVAVTVIGVTINDYGEIHAHRLGTAI